MYTLICEEPDCYLVEGAGLDERYPASPTAGLRLEGPPTGDRDEAWAGGYDPQAGDAKRRLRLDAQAIPFVEVGAPGRSRSLAVDTVGACTRSGSVTVWLRSTESAVPRFLVDDLAVPVAGREPGPGGHATKGRAVQAQGFQRTVLTAKGAPLALMCLHPHALRPNVASCTRAAVSRFPRDDKKPIPL